MTKHRKSTRLTSRRTRDTAAARSLVQSEKFTNYKQVVEWFDGYGGDLISLAASRVASRPFYADHMHLKTVPENLLIHFVDTIINEHTKMRNQIG